MTRKEAFGAMDDILATKESTETTAKSFFRAVFQWTDRIFEDVKEVSEIPDKFGINHFQAICDPTHRESYITTVEQIVGSLVSAKANTVSFFIPSIFKDNVNNREISKIKPYYKQIGSKEILVCITQEDGSVIVPDEYISLHSAIEQFLVLFTALKGWLETKHITKNTIETPIRVLSVLRNAAYAAYILLPANDNNMITVSKDIMGE